MTNFFVGKKGTLLAIAGKINHLHILCTDPFFDKHRGRYSVLAVNISSVRDSCPFDDACVLQAGDHSFIKHTSYVRYKDAVLMGIDHIQKSITSGDILAMEDVSDEVFQKVMTGFRVSRSTPRKILKILDEQEPPQ